MLHKEMLVPFDFTFYLAKNGFYFNLCCKYFNNCHLVQVVCYVAQCLPRLT